MFTRCKSITFKYEDWLVVLNDLPGAAFWSGTRGMVRILEVHEADKALDLPKNNLNLGHL